MLQKSDVINFGKKIIENSTDFENAIELITDYIEFLERFISVDQDIKHDFNILLVTKYPDGLFNSNSKRQSYREYYPSSSSYNSCGSSSYSGSSCGSGYTNHC